MGSVSLRPFRFGRRGVTPQTVMLAMSLLLLSAAGVAGYQQLFSSFAPYDDEGYMMISLRMYLAGHPLYEETYTQYGPAFYVLNGLLHHASALPVSHDVIRIKTLFVWLATAAMCSGFIYRVTRSAWLASLALLLTFFHLDRLGLEPGHPQDICLLTISATLLLGTWIGRAGVREDSSRSNSGSWETTASRWLGASAGPWLSGLLGLLSATAAMTKINIGGLLLLGVAIALLVAGPRGRIRTALLTLFLAGAALLPFALARHHVWEFDGLQLPVVILASIAAVMVASAKVDHHGCISPACWWAFAAGCVGGCLLYAWASIAHGTSWRGLGDGLIFQHLGFMQGFYENPPIYPWAAATAVLALTAAIASRFGWPPAARLARLALIVLLVGVGLRHLADTFTAIQHGADDRGQAALLISLCTPLLWMLFLPYGEASSRADPWLRRTRFSRLLLCAVALLQPLGVYPVPGTQTALGSLGLLLALLICIWDVVRFPATLGGDEALFRRSLAGGLIGLALLTVVCRVVYLTHQRAALTPLELAGGERLCLPADYVAKKRWTVRQLRARAATFICMQNGHNSLYFWSRLDPPTPINTTLWQDLLDDEQQRRIITALDQAQRACVVWEGSEPLPRRRDGPLTRWILDNFRPVAQHGSTEIWTRRGKELPASAAISALGPTTE